MIIMKYTIYEVFSLDIENKNIYIGYSKNFRQRVIDHKNPYNDNPKNKYFNKLLYKHIRENGKWNNFIIKPIEVIQTDNILDVRMREQFWMDERKSTLNKINSIDKNETRANYKKELYKNTKLIRQNKLIELVKKFIEH